MQRTPLAWALILVAGWTAPSAAGAFGTGQTLKQGVSALGIEPVVMMGDSITVGVFGHLGYGLRSGVDMDMKVGYLQHQDLYYGGDIEFRIAANRKAALSLALGGHYQEEYGLDGTLNFSFGKRTLSLIHI